MEENDRSADEVDTLLLETGRLTLSRTRLPSHAVREALAFIVLLVVAGLGWKQPYSEHWRRLTGKNLEARSSVTRGNGVVRPPSPPPPIAAVPAQPVQDAGQERSWMFQPSSMDAPHSKTHGR